MKKETQTDITIETLKRIQMAAMDALSYGYKVDPQYLKNLIDATLAKVKKGKQR